MAKIKRSVFALEQEYVYASYIDDVVAKIESGSPIYYHSDRQFNVRGLTNLSGNIVELYSYTPYGKQTILTATGTEINESAYNNCYGYTGRYLDEETGLWYFRARYFDNELGRFISRDPLGFVDGMSLYNGYFATGFGVDPSGYKRFDSYSELTLWEADFITDDKAAMGYFKWAVDVDLDGNVMKLFTFDRALSLESIGGAIGAVIGGFFDLYLKNDRVFISKSYITCGCDKCKEDSNLRVDQIPGSYISDSSDDEYYEKWHVVQGYK